MSRSKNKRRFLVSVRGFPRLLPWAILVASLRGWRIPCRIYPLASARGSDWESLSARLRSRLGLPTRLRRCIARQHRRSDHTRVVSEA